MGPISGRPAVNPVPYDLAAVSDVPCFEGCSPIVHLQDVGKATPGGRAVFRVGAALKMLPPRRRHRCAEVDPQASTKEGDPIIRAVPMQSWRSKLEKVLDRRDEEVKIARVYRQILGVTFRRTRPGLDTH